MSFLAPPSPPLHVWLAVGTEWKCSHLTNLGGWYANSAEFGQGAQFTATIPVFHGVFRVPSALEREKERVCGGVEVCARPCVCGIAPGWT